MTDSVFSYDDGGRRTALTDASSHTTVFAYDTMGRMTSLTYPNSDVETYAFDAAGRMTAKTTPNSDTIVLAYSPVGAMTLKTYPDASTVVYSFDDGGRRTRVVDANTDNSYLYDDGGRLTQVSDAKYATPKEIAYFYDKTGARTLLDRPDGDDITYFYDARGAMTLIKEGASNRAVYSFDDAGAVTKTLLGNGSYTEYSTDGVGRLTLLSNKKSDTSVISAFGYTLDPTGNRVGMAIAGSAYTSADIAYTYDDAYQLTGEVRTGGDAYCQYFYYDASGNRTKKTLGGTDTVYVYNTSDQLTSETTGGVTTTYEYDPNGALTKADDGTTVQSYEYNCEGRMTAYAMSGGSTVAYAYDADGRRIAKTVDAATTKFFYDGSDAIADYDAWSERVEGADDTLIATYLTPSLDGNISVTRSASTYYYMKDGLGSIRNVVESDEDTANTYDYYAFGKELGSWTENVTNRYTYTAREWDDESGQYYYRARYYDGGGRFGGRDPARDGANLYVYVRNEPVRSVDPYGLLRMKGKGKYKCCADEKDGSDGWLRLLVKQDYVMDGVNNPGIGQDYANANDILSQCCIQVHKSGSSLTVDRVNTRKALGNNDNVEDPADVWLNVFSTEPKRMYKYAGATGGINTFLVQRFEKTSPKGSPVGAPFFVNGIPQIAVADNRKADTFAHEIVHTLGIRGDLRGLFGKGNLMHWKRTSSTLTAAQCDTIRKSAYLTPYPKLGGPSFP